MRNARRAKDLADPLIAFMNGRGRTKATVELVICVRAVLKKLRLPRLQGERLFHAPLKVCEPRPADGQLEDLGVAGVLQGFIDPLQMDHRRISRRQHRAKKIENAGRVYTPAFVEFFISVAERGPSLRLQLRQGLCGRAWVRGERRSRRREAGAPR